MTTRWTTRTLVALSLSVLGACCPEGDLPCEASPLPRECARFVNSEEGVLTEALSGFVDLLRGVLP